MSDCFSQKECNVDRDIATHAEEMAQEIEQAHEQGILHHNSTHIVDAKGSTNLLEKQHIHEGEISLDPKAAHACPAIAAWDADSSLRTMLSVLWPQLTSPVAFSGQATKVQVNTGAPAIKHVMLMLLTASTPRRECRMLLACLDRFHWARHLQLLVCHTAQQHSLAGLRAHTRLQPCSQVTEAASRCTLTHTLGKIFAGSLL